MRDRVDNDITQIVNVVNTQMITEKHNIKWRQQVVDTLCMYVCDSVCV